MIQVYNSSYRAKHHDLPLYTQIHNIFISIIITYVIIQLCSCIIHKILDI